MRDKSILDLDLEKSRRRSKISNACDTCRSRKVRCDGQRPACSRCCFKQINCTYTRRERKQYSAEYIRTLEERVRSLEEGEPIQLQQSPQGIDGSRSPSISADKIYPKGLINITPESHSTLTPETHPISPPHSDGPVEHLTHNQGSIEKHHSSFQTELEEEERPNAMGAAALPKTSFQRDFYGSSSAVSFMRLIQAATAQSELLDGQQQVEKVIKPYKMAGASVNKSQKLSLDKLVLPPRRLADQYVACYFRYVFSLYPFVHQHSFMESYNAIWLGGQDVTEDSLYYCILNIVFAFGCLLSPDQQTPHRETTAQVYFERSKELLHFELLDTGSLILVQALLLTGQYLQATNSPSKCWNVIGLAIRVAQGLGLHRESAVACRSSFIEQQVCRRLWYGCMVMDRVVGMTFGRPLGISQPFRINLPAFVNDEYITDREILEQPAELPSVHSFFKETIILYDIMGCILKEFYDVQGSENPLENPVDPCEARTAMFNSIVSLESKLTHFKRGMSRHLNVQYIEELPSDSPYIRQANILHARYLHVRIMLYRPVLLPHNIGYSRKSEHNVTSHLRLSIEKTICKLCVEAALEVIQLMYDNKDTHNIPAWWYCIYYAHTAATVLLAAKLFPAIDVQNIAMEEGWQMALNLLRSFEVHGNSATRCLQVLEMLHDRISSMSKPHDKPPFDLLPNLIDVDTDFGSGDILLSMMNEQGPFSDVSLEYLLRGDFEYRE